MIRRPPRSTLFPSPPLSRSAPGRTGGSTRASGRGPWGCASRPPRCTGRGPSPAACRRVRRHGAAPRGRGARVPGAGRSEEHTSELQSQSNLVCRLLREKKNACNMTDGQRALVRISSLAAATIALQEGVEPIMQMVSRDRHRIGLQSDLLRASALGIHNVLCLWGDPPPAGNEKDAKAVFDLSTEEMIATFRALRDTGTLRGGDQVEQAPKVFIGAAADPFRGSKEESFGKLRGKVTAGADFVQTQGVYDVDAFEEWMRLVRKERLH